MKLRTILFVLALLAFLSASSGGYLYYSSLKKSVYEEGKRQSFSHTLSIQHRVSSILSENLKSVKALAGLNDLKRVFSGLNKNKLEDANLTLDHFQNALEANVCYIMDARGNTLASSNRNSPNSFVGKNYAFRPYFKNAMQGLPSVYMALGVTSNQRGIYYSHPIFVNGLENPVGVVVVKASVKPIESELQAPHTTSDALTLITDPHGVIFISSTEKWLFHTLHKLPDDELDLILKTRQFGNGPFKWIGLKKNGNNHVLLGSGEEYLLNRARIASYPGWSVCHLTNLGSISNGISDPLISTTGYVTLTLCLLMGGSVFLLYRVASSDIRRRKKAEQALKASEANYRAVFNAANDAVFIHDMNTGQILDVNQRMCEMFGYSPEEARSLDIGDVSSGKDAFTQENALKWIQKAAQGFPQLLEWMARDKSGREFWVEVNLKRALIGGKQRLLAVVRDISERKQAEEALLKSEERYRIVSELTSDLSYAFNITSDNHVESDWVAGALSRITGYTAEELAADGGWESLIFKEDILITMKQLETLLSGKSCIVEYRILTKSGKVRWMLDYGYPVWSDAQQRVIKAYGAVQDITERKQAEEALKQSEENYKTLTNNLHVGIYRNTIGPDGKFLEANPAIVNMFGFSNRDEFLAVSVSELYQDPNDRKKFNKKMLSNELVRNEELRLKKKDGTEFIGSVSAVAVKDQNGGVKYYDGVIEDITERKQLESQLQQAQRMEAIGTLAGGIAHDFNNILAAAIGYTEMALNGNENNSALKSNLQEVLKAGNRAKNLVRQILAFSRQADQEVKPLQVKIIVKEALKLLRASLPATIEIQPNIKSEAVVLADPTQIHQVLMNLCTNAQHAMRETGGLLKVSLTDVEIEQGLSAKRLGVSAGKHLCLKVSDTGHGMSSMVIDRIFDPFFTTKPRDEGTGMGLAVVHGIVTGYKGALTVESEVGKGSTFKIYLPTVEREISAPAKSIPKNCKGSESILFIDDEIALLDIGQQMLDRLGYHVVTRSSSLEALELFQAGPDEFDLVITDMTMPNMTGDKLAQEMMFVRPDIPVILCTGYSHQITEEKAKSIGIKEFIFKPIAIDDLARTIRSVLDNVK